MSDEQRRDDEIEVEGHGPRLGGPRPGGPRQGENDEPIEDAEDEFEAHVQRFSNVRMD